MATLLDNIDTIVLVMFENRSFDHFLGHLSYDKLQTQADGLLSPLSQEQYENLYKGTSYKPFRIPKDINLEADLPHEFDAVDTQLAKSDVTGAFTMSGFVEAYAKATGSNPNTQADPMGFFSASQVPISSFLAQHFCVCDRWFCPLPSSTQPNRTMAFCGESAIHNTKTRPIPANNNIFDWLTTNQVRWRDYHDGLSFFALYPSLWDHMLGKNFRDYEFLFSDRLHEDSDTAPQVILVEPSYQDAPHIGPDHPNDNHAPLAIGWGEDFLRRTYEAISANKARWEKTLMVVYYDEHGGFFDHVPPPLVTYSTTGNNPHHFASMGPRVPALLISPLVEPGSVCHDVFDHTSVLQLLAEKFTPGQPYSASVQARSQQPSGPKSISVALTNTAPFLPPHAPAGQIAVTSALGDSIAVAPTPSQAMAQSFEMAAQNLLKDEKPGMLEKYPELFQWRDAVAKARGAS